MRYFIITFVWKGEYQGGNGDLTHTSNQYPNRKEICKHISQLLKDINLICIENQTIITNIIELSEEDYKYWNE